MSVDIVISGGTIVTPEKLMDASIAIDDGTIVAVGDGDAVPVGNRTIDASGQLVMPGVVDPHVHIEGYLSVYPYETETKAAALGGITSGINFAWQAWIGELSNWDEPGTLVEAVERQKRKGEESLIDFALHGAITREDPAVLEEIPALIDHGVTSYKMFTAYEIGLSNGFINQVLHELAEHDAIAVFHTEDDSVCEHLTAELKRKGQNHPRHYPKSRPDYSEAMAVDDALRMAQNAGTRYYGIHTTSRAAAEVIEGYQDDRSEVRAETCTHYATLDESAYETQGSLPIIAPPLRTPDDREAMYDHLRKGTLSHIGSDHVALERETKDVEDWWESSFGANSLQTSLPVFHEEAVNKRGFSYPFLVRVMCRNPARTFGLPGKGTLEPGTDADIVIFDPNETYTIDAANNASGADYSIYQGRDVTGRVKKTLLRGEVIAENGEITANPGYGEYIDRTIPDWEP